MSTQQQVPKPSLTGVRIKARKGAVKASAKHEPQVFRDQLYRHLETVQPGDFEGYANKLILAGSQLDFSKYSDALFEILLAGGLLQPGGTYLEEQNVPAVPFSIVNASEPVEVEEMKKYVEVFNKLLRRYKYLQKPLEEASLPSLLQYSHRWTPSHRSKLSYFIGLLLSQSLISSSALLTLTKDHLVKDYLSISLLTLVFKAYLSDQAQGIESLGAALKKGGVKELTEFLPVNKRTPTELEGWFKKEGLPEVGEWYKRKRLERIRKTLLSGIKEHVEKGEDNDSIISWLKETQSETSVPDTDLIAFVWSGLMGSVDWANAKPEQVEALAIRKVTEWADIFEAFTSGPKTEVALIGAAQVYCYEENKIMKAFPQILKVLYNKDCVSDQAILYWHSKGSKPQGRQHFLNATQPLVNFLREQEDSDEDED